MNGKTIFGLIILAAAAALLFWNENRAARTQRALEESGGVVVSLAPSALSSAQDGALVHAVGNISTQAQLVDTDLGVARSALRLTREVEMFQWRRIAGTGDTQDRYETTWSADLISSTGFAAGRVNPDSLPFASASWQAEPAVLGTQQLSVSLLNRLSGLQPLELTGAELAAIRTALSLELAEFSDGRLYLPLGFGSPDSPQIGDVRVRYTWAPTGTYSVVARKSGQHLEPFVTGSGVTIAMLRSGSVSASEMIDVAQSQSSGSANIMRVIGGILAVIGAVVMFRRSRGTPAG